MFVLNVNLSNESQKCQIILIYTNFVYTFVEEIKNMAKFKYEKWSVGKDKMTVITDSEVGLTAKTGHAGPDAKMYFGGNLICESVLRPKDVHIIASSQLMLEALENLENDDNQIDKNAWNMVQSAIILARNK